MKKLIIAAAALMLMGNVSFAQNNAKKETKKAPAKAKTEMKKVEGDAKETKPAEEMKKEKTHSGHHKMQKTEKK